MKVDGTRLITFVLISISFSRLTKHQQDSGCALKKKVLSGSHMEIIRGGDNVMEGKSEIRSEVFGSVEYTQS